MHEYQLKRLARETVDEVEVEPSELHQLGRRRAEAIESTLVQEGSISSNRVLLTTKGKVQGAKGKVRLELEVE